MTDPLFPAFSRFALEAGRDARFSKGILAAKLPRILGEGNTRASMAARPAPIERKQELVGLNWPDGFDVPADVQAEIETVRAELTVELRALTSEEGARRLASQVVTRLPQPAGLKNDKFHAGGLVLTPDARRENWSWSITEHYPLIEKMPPDVDFIIAAFECAQAELKKLLLPSETFEQQLERAWQLARSPADRQGDVRVADVARMYLVAAQPDRFWNKPAKANFVDLPQAAFIANLRHWLRQSGAARRFELLPATLNQVKGSKGAVLYLPLDAEGTQTRPYIFIRPTAPTPASAA